MNLPKEPGMPVAGQVTGTSGVLALDYPNYCGYFQVDVLIGPSPWMIVSGVRHPDFACVPPTTTTTTTTTTPVVVSSTTVPPNVASSTTVPNGSSSVPFTATSGTTTPSQLPFTGMEIKPLAILGGLLILIGGMVLTTVESRRRLLLRATGPVKSGARKTSSWLLGS